MNLGEAFDMKAVNNGSNPLTAADNEDMDRFWIGGRGGWVDGEESG